MKLHTRKHNFSLLTVAFGVVCGLLAIILSIPASSALAQSDGPQPEIVATWQETGGHDYSLYRPTGAFAWLKMTGIIWWDTALFAGPSCPPPPGENTNDGANIQIKGWWKANPHTIEDVNCKALAYSDSANVVRSGQMLYYFVDGQLSRKAINLGPDVPATPLANAPRLTLSSGSAVLALDSAGYLVWADHVIHQQLGEYIADNVFYRMKADDSEPAQQLFVHKNVRPVTQLAAMIYTVTGIHLRTLAWRTNQGDLYRYQPVSGGGASVVKLADNVREFAVHLYRVDNIRNATILAVTGAGVVTPSSPTSKLVQINPRTAAQNELSFNLQGKNQLVSVAVDSDSLTPTPKNIYVSEAFYNCSANTCQKEQGNRIYRRQLFTDGQSGSCIEAFCLMLDREDGGVQLESDDLWLYFARGDKLYRFPTNAPPIERDFVATHLEVNQAIQNLHNEFALVAGHPTVVRGYATLAQDSTGVNHYQVTARLTATLNGQPLPETLLPVKSVILNQSDTLVDQRQAINKTYLFKLPDHWVRNLEDSFTGAFVPSRLKLTMTINADNALGETVGGQYANNSVEATVDVFQRATTCLAVVPMLTEAPIPNLEQLPMAELVKNVHRLWPASGIKVYYHTFPYWFDENVKEELWMLTDDGDPFHLSGLPLEEGDGTSGGGLVALAALASLSSSPCPGSTHWLGAIHEETDMDGFKGWGVNPGRVFMAKLYAKDVVASASTVTHELMHNVGREHTNCGDLPASQQNFDWVGLGLGEFIGYPITYHRCDLGPTDLNDLATFVGLDTHHLAVKLPADHPDIMSYASNRWVSLLNWYWLFNNPRLMLPFPSLSEARITSEEVVLVQGEIGPQLDVGKLHLVQQLPASAAPAEHLVEAANHAAHQDDDSIEIRLVDGAGVTLYTTAVNIHAGSTHGDVAEPHQFIQYLPFDTQTQRVQLVVNGQVLAERAISDNAPTVQLTHFAHDARSERIDLTWAATDPDGDLLSALVLYSSDDGATWRALGNGFGGSDSTYLGTQNLPASERARLRVLVNDGFRTGMATSEPFAIAPHPPTPLIDNLVEGQRLNYADRHPVYGIAYDPDEGSLNPEQLQWIITGPISATHTGDSITLSDMVPGDYTLTLRATDSSGLRGETSVGFAVQPLAVPTGTTPLFDGSCADEAYGDGVTVRLPRSRRTIDEGRWPEVRMLHAEGALYVCFTDQGYGERADNRMVGIQVDTDNSGGATAAAGDIGFFINQDGIASQMMPFFGVMVSNPQPKTGYEAIIDPGATRWSAELRIDETLIGGWDHPVRLLFKHEITDVLSDAANWPPSAAHSQPGTWADAYFGAPPPPSNQPPVANAGTDVQIQVSTPITLYLDGGLSFDPDGDPLTYRWRQVGGPTVTLEDPNQRLVPFTVAPVQESTDLQFELIVNDGQTDSAPDGFLWRLLPASATEPVDPGTEHVIYLPLLGK